MRSIYNDQHTTQGSIVPSIIFLLTITKASDYNAHRKVMKRQKTNFKLETDFTNKFRHKDWIKSNCKEISRCNT